MSRRFLPIGTALAGLGFLLRLAGIEAQSLWLDESFTYARTLGIRDGTWLAPGTGYQIRHLAWDVLITPWAPLGDELGLRWISVLAGTLTAVLMAAVAHRLAGWRAAAISGLVAALSPVLVQFGQEGRQYALVIALVMLALWAALHAERRMLWLLPVIALAATALHALSAMYTGLVAAWVVLRGIQRGRRTLISVGLLSGALALGGVAFVYGFESRTPFLQWIEPPGLRTLGEVLLLGLNLHQIEAPLTLLALLMLPLAGLVIAAASAEWPRWGLPVGLALLPPAVLAAFSYLIRPLFALRYVLPSAALIALLLGLSLAWLLEKRSTLGRVMLAVMLGASLVMLGLYRLHPEHQRADWRGAIAQLDPQPGDKVVAFHISPLALYAPQIEAEQVSADDHPPTVETVQEALNEGRRVWFVWSRFPDAVQSAAPEDWLEPALSGAARTFEHHTNGVSLYRYAPEP